MALSDINARALWWTGPLTVAVAVLLVLAAQRVAFALLDLPREFPPLTAQGLVFFTVVGVGLGVSAGASVGASASLRVGLQVPSSPAPSSAPAGFHFGASASLGTSIDGAFTPTASARLAGGRNS